MGVKVVHHWYADCQAWPDDLRGKQPSPATAKRLAKGKRAHVEAANHALVNCATCKNRGPDA